MKTLVFDLDGTMYRGTSIIEDAKLYIDYCIEHHIPYKFITNNAMRTRQMNTDHMVNMGYEGILPEQFFNSAMASAKYVKAHYAGNKAFFLGEEGLHQALIEEGFEITDQSPDFVFVGLQSDCCYKDYCKALTLILNGAKFIGTNRDRILPKPDGFQLGNGAIMAMFEYAINDKSPDISKPNKNMLELFLEYFHLSKDDIIIVGDNLETDIRLGYENGVKTIFVTTGVHSKEDIERFQIYPDITVDSLLELKGMEL